MMRIHGFSRRGRVFCLLGAVVLSGCAADMKSAGPKAASENMQAASNVASKGLGSIQKVRNVDRASNIVVRKAFYLGEEGFREGRGNPLPEMYEGEHGISLRLGRNASIVEVAQIIQRFTGIRVDLKDLSAPVGYSDSIQPMAVSGSDSSGIIGASGSFATDSSALTRTFRVDYEGPLSAFLDYASSQIGVDWEYSGGRIKFIGPRTEVYTIWSFPGKIQASGGIGSGGDSGTFGSGKPPATDYSYEFEYWADIEAGLRAIIPETAAFSINRSTGAIVVTGPQAVHERVRNFIEKENGKLSRQVAVKVDVISVDMNDARSLGMDFDAVLDQVSAGLRISAGMAGNAIAGAGVVGVDVTGRSEGILNRIAGSSAALSALAERGGVSVVKSTSLIAMNNQPTPVSLVREKGFVSGVSETSNGDGTTSLSLDTGIVNDGLKMTLTPRIMSTGQVMITYHMTLTDMVDLQQFNAGDMMVQIPETQSRTFMQTISMRSGDSMVIAAYENGKSSRKTQGIVDASAWGLGGKSDYLIENNKILIVITPVVIRDENRPSVGG